MENDKNRRLINVTNNFLESQRNFASAVSGLGNAMDRLYNATGQNLSVTTGISLDSLIWVSELLGITVFDLANFHLENNCFPDDADIKKLFG